MTARGTELRYGSVAIAFHWACAAAIIALIALGFLAAGTDDPAQKATLLRFHVPLGMLTLVLMVSRLAWRLFDHRPRPAAGQPAWQAVTARLTHAALYLVVLLVGGSGVALMVVSGAGAVLFSAAPALPDFSQYGAMIAHGVGAFVLVGLLGMHIGAACYHQFYKRDGLLTRMGVGSSAPVDRLRPSPHAVSIHHR